MTRSALVFLFFSVAAGTQYSPCGAAVIPPDAERAVGRPLPRLAFEDDSGRRRDTGEFAGLPLIVVPIFTRCESTCPVIATRLKQGLLKLTDSGTDLRSFQVLLFSFDPEDTRESLQEFRARNRLPAAWTLARLEPNTIRVLTDALDYRPSGAGKSEWTHPNAIGFFSPRLTLSGFLYGTEFTPSRIRDLLEEARQGSSWIARFGSVLLAVSVTGLIFSAIVLTHLTLRRQ